MVDIRKSKRIVIKIGSVLLIDLKKGVINYDWLESITNDIMHLKEDVDEIVIVTSGAIALGRGRLNIGENRSLVLREKQAAAACGQTMLIKEYRDKFSKYNLQVAQILLSIEDSENRRRYLNARSTIETLLAANIVPIINENDTVATDEIKFGDNDKLAARVAQMIGADILILLSDIDGLYSANPKINKDAKFLEKVEYIDKNIMQMADRSSSQFGSGGMVTKLEAAKIATSSGCTTILCKGKTLNPIKALENGGKHTLFVAKDDPRSFRKKWIADSLAIKGKVTIDSGAMDALNGGNSLLPVGVTKISGNFNKGDTLSIIDENGKEVARGLVSYPANEAEQIIGRKASEIESLLGYHGGDEIIHRNNMVMDSDSHELFVLDSNEYEDNSTESKSEQMGTRMISAGLISQEQRDLLVKKQQNISESGGKWIRFGELAAMEGFCTTNEVEEMMNTLAERLESKVW